MQAGLAGFEVGNGVACTGEVARVTFNLNKRYSVRALPNMRLGLLEVRLTLTNGITKRTTMLFAGKHALRAPLPVEMVEIIGTICVAVFLGALVALISSALRQRAELVAAQNCGPAGSLERTGAGEGPPSVT